MGLTTLPEVGTGEALGPVKVSRPFAAPDPLRDITVAEHNAAMEALQDVCAEVGLHDGSTAGSLVERVTALEDAPPGSGDVVGPASSVIGRIAIFDDTSGKLIDDSGVAITAIAAAQGAADDAQATADDAIPRPSPVISGNLPAWTGTLGDLADSGIPSSFVLTGAVGSGVSTLAVAGPTALVDASNRGHVIVDTTTVGGDVTVTVPHNLTAQVAVDLRVKGAHGLILGTSGGIALTYHGWTQGATITGDGTFVRVVIESTTVAHVYVYPVGEPALPKPGGTTTANGIAYGTGTSGAAVAISTTTIADLQKRLGNVFTLNANTVLDDTYSGGVIFTDTSGGARSHTIPPTVSAGWNAIFVREGANTLNIVGSTVGADTMLMAGPAAAANAVAIAVDNGGVSVIRRSATKCWCAGVIA